MKLSKAIEGYKLVSLAEGFSPRTMEGYRWSLGRLTRFFHNRGTDDPDLDETSSVHLRDFFLHLRAETDLASSSTRSVWRTIRSFYNWASRDLGVKRPDENIPMPQVGTRAIVPFREEEVKALVKACEHTSPSSTAKRRAFALRRPLASRDRALALVLLDTRLRVSESARLQVQDMNLATGALHVRTFRSGLKSRGRMLFLVRPCGCT